MKVVLLNHWDQNLKHLSTRKSISRRSLAPTAGVAAFSSFVMARSKGRKATLFLSSVAVLLMSGAPAVCGRSALGSSDPDANGAVRVAVAQPDGRILVGGDPTALLPNGGVTVSLPTVTIDTSVINFTQPVVTSAIDSADHLIGFQGDVTFDSSVLAFQSTPVSSAGLTGGNWTVSGNILPGPGPMRTLRVSAFSNDGVTPLSGSGTLYNLNMIRVSSIPGASSALTWGAPPDNFIFADANLVIHAPGSTPPGSVTIQIVTTVSLPTAIIDTSATNFTQPVMTSPISAADNLIGFQGDFIFDSSVVTFQGTPVSNAGLTSGNWTVAGNVLPGPGPIRTLRLLAFSNDGVTPLSGSGTLFDLNLIRVSGAPGVSTTLTWAALPDNLVFIDANLYTHAPGSAPPGSITIHAVATVSLPAATINMSVTNFTQPVMTSAISAADNLIGFQGDFAFDSSVVTFQSTPVSNAGLTGGNWNVAGNVLPGPGPIRTLRLLAFSNDGVTPLSGSGILFNLNLTRISGTSGAGTALTWAAPPDSLLFIDANLITHPPGDALSGSITLQGITISGTISYCSNPVPGPVPNVALNLTGSGSGSMLSDSAGDYQLSSLASGGSYIVTPTKTALTPGSPGITIVDVIAVQRHFLNLSLLPVGCRRDAADVNGDTVINVLDVIAVQRFFLGLPTGIANTGKYRFTPASRAYPGIASDQTGQNFDTLIFGDVAFPFADRVDGPLQGVAGDGGDAGELPPTVAVVALPDVVVDQSKGNFVAAVTATAIDTRNRLVGFQGDFTFDERVITFQSPPVSNAGITGGNWNVSGNVVPGAGPIRTLRISAYSNDFTPLAGSGTLFELRMTKVGKAAQETPLIWAAPPKQFIFADADLNTQRPGNAATGSVTLSVKRQ